MVETRSTSRKGMAVGMTSCSVLVSEIQYNMWVVVSRKIQSYKYMYHDLK